MGYIIEIVGRNTSYVMTNGDWSYEVACASVFPTWNDANNQRSRIVADYQLRDYNVVVRRAS